jgi:SAM-dependent methyltransferase
MKCQLCHQVSHHFYRHNHREYYFCSSCFSIALDPHFFLSPKEEQTHYDCHQNNASDSNYRAFVKPITETVLQEKTNNAIGLDFGSGRDSSIIGVMAEHEFAITPYDPYYFPDTQLKKNHFDYITCCEVVEHFQNPNDSFQQLFDLLKPDGTLYIMTDLYSENIHFDEWYYKNDPTHVFFYHEKTFQWIEKYFGFEKLKIKKRLVQLSKPPV